MVTLMPASPHPKKHRERYTHQLPVPEPTTALGARILLEQLYQALLAIAIPSDIKLNDLATFPRSHDRGSSCEV